MPWVAVGWIGVVALATHKRLFKNEWFAIIHFLEESYNFYSLFNPFISQKTSELILWPENNKISLEVLDFTLHSRDLRN